MSLHDEKMILIRETEKAILCKAHEDAPSHWFPRSQIETHDPKEPRTSSGPIIVVTMPEWLAVEKGLV